MAPPLMPDTIDVPPSRLGVASLIEWIRSPLGRKVVKYSMVSVVSTIVSQAVLFLTYGVLRLWPAVACNIVANVVAAVPSYYLNRNWAWGKSGRSHLFKEVLPFWASSLAGMALSIMTVDFAQRFAQSNNLSHLAASVLVNTANLTAFGVLWLAKFILYNRLLFVTHDKAAIGGAASEAEPESV
ncbi:MAG: GtrA family protein [Actinobacteria bacterium]|nr:GtrA family protein [Actinomycetota bacterium]